MTETLSLGERRVRIKFNPSDSSQVYEIKKKAAELINYINDNMLLPEDIAPEEKGEYLRIKALAMTEIESASHWAVKTATW